MRQTIIKRTWTYGYCESCLKNSHEKVEVVKDSEGIWVCVKCGATKRL